MLPYWLDKSQNGLVLIPLCKVSRTVPFQDQKPVLLVLRLSSMREKSERVAEK
ncbi:hypothetical protein WMY93_033374, partial [Mugilogobius chulae]